MLCPFQASFSLSEVLATRTNEMNENEFTGWRRKAVIRTKTNQDRRQDGYIAIHFYFYCRSRTFQIQRVRILRRGGMNHQSIFCRSHFSELTYKIRILIHLPDLVHNIDSEVLSSFYIGRWIFSI